MAQPHGLLLVSMNYTRVAEDEFNDWYDTEHFVERANTPGFLTARRWLGVADPKVSMTTYDLDTLDVLETPAYKAIVGENLSPWSRRVVAKATDFFRFTAEQLKPGRETGAMEAEGIVLVAMNVAPEAEGDFNAWYDEEHLDRLKAVPGVLRARRYRAAVGKQRYLALYDLASPDVADSPAWKAAVDTPWTARVKPHFRDVIRLVMRRYHRQPKD